MRLVWDLLVLTKVMRSTHSIVVASKLVEVLSANLACLLDWYNHPTVDTNDWTQASHQLSTRPGQVAWLSFNCLSPAYSGVR